MKMDKKGQVIIVAMMIAIMVLIIAIELIPPLRSEVDTAINSTSLNCTDPTTSTVHKATCTTLDIGFFYFIAMAISIGIVFLTGKKNITGILTAIFVFVVVVVLIEPLKVLIVNARSSSYLDCTNTAISVGSRMTCIFVDLWLFYFVAITLTAAVGFIFVKKVLPKFGVE